ncbi:MAG: hypothetical protein [Podoviridae sp. ctpVR23]|nr:MAG: hypothetical protein [Podoviridae sp. ctpVR23]
MTKLDTTASYGELAERFKFLKDKIEEMTLAIKPYQDELTELRQKTIPAKMEEEGVSTVNVKGFGRITCTSQMSCSTIDPNGLKQWLVDNGYEGLIQPVVNSSTLKSFVKERIEAGEDYPSDCINISFFTQASLTKA